MSPLLSQIQRRAIIPLMVVVLVIYYLVVLLPLSRHARSLDEPLQSGWQSLCAALEQTNATTLDFLHVTNQLSETRQAIVLLDNAKQKAAARLDLSSAVRAKVNAPFQLVDYQDERSRQLDELIKQAKAAQVTIEPAVFGGFPEHTADTRQPNLLWAALSQVQSLLGTALLCKVSVIHSLDVPVSLTNTIPVNGGPLLTEIPLLVELSGSAGNVLKLLQNLPLRADEMKAGGLADAPRDKVPFFIDRLVLKKQSPDKPDEVRVWLRVIGFVMRE